MVTIAAARSLWIEGIERHLPLTDEEKQAMSGVPMRLRGFSPQTDIVRDGERPEYCCVILEGFCWRYKINSFGKRQILSLHQAGDMPDLQSLHLKRMDHTLGTITRAEIGFVSHHDLKELTHRLPRLSDALWRSTLLDAAIFREWIVNLGTRTAAQRAAHLFCEMYILASVAGHTENYTYELPLTQEDLGDALGISTVHANRSLRQLREAGWVTIGRNMITIEDFEGLKKFAGFDPAYLDIGMQNVVLEAGQ